jgi:hypothetical protein
MKYKWSIGTEDIVDRNNLIYVCMLRIPLVKFEIYGTFSILLARLAEI